MAGKFQWLGITLLAAVVGLLSGTLSAYQLLKVPLQHLSLTTPVFVMDRARLIRALPPNATPEHMAQAVEDFAEFVRNSEVRQYRVLDAGRVIQPALTFCRIVDHCRNVWDGVTKPRPARGLGDAIQQLQDSRKAKDREVHYGR